MNRPLAAEEERAVKAASGERRRQARSSFIGVPSTPGQTPAADATPQEREKEFEARWNDGGLVLMSAFTDLLTSAEANQHAAEFVRGKIGATVADPAVAERLKPRGYAIGTKRLCVDTGYFEIFNRDNVTLVDVREAPIEEITAHGVRTADDEYDLDVLVFATGFDAMTGALMHIDVRGRGDASLRDAWADGPRTYLGLSAAGFPNLFLVTGPGSPSVLSNMVLSIEQHVEWIAGCIGRLRGATIEATQAAEDAWVAHVNEVAEATLFPRAASWYMGANIPGKPRVFMPYLGGVGV